MNKETAVTIVSLFIGSTALTKGIEWFWNRKKTGAETHNLNITGDISIGTAWQEYARQMETNFKTLETKFVTLQTNFDTIKAENISFRSRITLLERILKDNNIQLP